VPTYQYACTACGHQLEAVQSFTDEPLTQCPACEGRLRKLFSSIGVVFKGSGFYRTDSRNGKANGHKEAATSAEPSSGSDSSSGSGSGSGSTESKGSSKGSSTGTSGAGSASAVPAKPAA
jgi:putative FmdB family regulatory protein